MIQAIDSSLHIVTRKDKLFGPIVIEGGNQRDKHLSKCRIPLVSVVVMFPFFFRVSL